MPWSNGVFTRYYPSWSNDAANNLPISASKFDGQDTDFATGISFALSKDGLSGPQQAMTWGLTSAQVLQLNRSSDGAVFGIGRTGGSNNPVYRFSIADAGGLTISGANTSSVTNQSASGYSVYNSVTVNTYGTLTMMINGTASTDASGIPAFQAGIGTANQLTLVLATNGTPRLSIAGPGGTVTVNAPSSGNSLVISGVNGGTALSISSGNTTNVASDIYVARPGSTANAFAQGPSLQLNDTASGGQTILQQSGLQTELWQYNGAWNQIFKVTSNRGFTLNQPAAATGMLNFASAAGSTTNPAFAFTSLGSTGSATATLTANKPGSNQGVAGWLSIFLAGQQYWMPMWSN